MTAAAGPVLIVHAGAGPRGGAVDEYEDACRRTLYDSLAAGAGVLEQGGDAVAAVRAAVMVMEAFEFFNAGHGSVLCEDGTVEMSAALMRSDRAAGAVAAVRTTRFPILGAESVMDSPQVLLVGAAADARAAQAGVEQRPNDAFITERQRRRLAQALAVRAVGATGTDHATVGAVCRDVAGGLAAGTSTGGIRGQPPGRVGDGPLIGSGTWADARVAVSCTGDGEAFIRSGVARYIGALSEAGVDVQEAARRALGQVADLDGEGGLIALDAAGIATTPFLTERMPRGVWRAGSEPQVWVTD